MEVINRGLKAMDTTAITMCMDNNIPVLAFALSEEGRHRARRLRRRDGLADRKRLNCGEETGSPIASD